MKWSKKALLAKIESAYGSDPTPAASANEVLVIGSDVELVPIVANAVPREVVRPAGEYGSFTEFMTGKHMALSFSVEMAGAGDNDTPPQYGVLLRACGLAQTINASTSVEYDPVSEAHESCAIYLAIDGTRFKLLGVRGDVSWEMSVNGVPMLRFTLMGLFTAAADATFPTMDYAAAVKPLVISDVNTPTFTLHGTAVKVAACSLRLGNAVEYRELVNSTEIVISNRQTAGQITIEQVLVATKDWYGAVVAETLAALQIIHGASAGNIIQFDAPKVQLKNPRLGGSQDRKMLTMDMVLTPDAGDDEIKFTTK